MREVNPWEEELIADVRANGGTPASGPLAGHPIMLLFSTGAKSGERRRSIVTYSRDGDGYVIAGTNGGNKDRHPAWYANLVADPAATVEVANRTFPVTAATSEGADRDRLWAQHVAQLPWFGKYEEQITGRTIPVVRLARKAYPERRARRR